MAYAFPGRAALSALVVSSVLLTTAATPTEASVIELRASISREILFIDPNSPEASAGFQLGESVTVEFSFDTSITDTAPNSNSVLFDDPEATYRLIGDTSGAILEYSPGLRIRLFNDFAFKIQSIANPADASNPLVLAGAAVWQNNPTTTIFNDTSDLSRVFDDLLATTFDTADGIPCSTSYWDGSQPLLAMNMRGPLPGTRFEPISNPGPTPCIADVTTTGATIAGQQGFGAPDGAADLDDLGYFLGFWINGDTTVADVTTTGATIAGQPGFGTADSSVDLDDLGYFLGFWLTGCP
ncbi:MAG: GC-type dockerin domain-anchored protein [Planctomycetota bacterium]